MLRLGILIGSLTFIAALSANGQSLKFTKYEAKDCLQMAWEKENIIKNETEFLQKIRNDMSREGCLKILEKIDFNKHDLVGKDINSGYCRYPIGLTFEGSKNIEKKEFEVNISYQKPNGVCRALSSYHLWLLIPKMPDEYKLRFNIYELKK